MAGKKSDDEFSIDLSSLRTFFKKIASGRNKAWLMVILILIPIFFSVYFRMYSYYLPVTDDWAFNNIYNSVRSQVSGQINQQYPNLPAPNKNQLIDEQGFDFVS
jgi:hypothetical protein